MDKLLQQVFEEIRGVARFRWYAILAAWLVCVAGWAIIMFMPDIYGASARVYVSSRTSLAPALQGLTINQDMDAQLNLVRQSLLSRPQLEKVAATAGILKPNASKELIAEVVNDLREQIKLNAESHDGSGGTVYTVAFEHRNREQARQLVQILLDNFRDNTLGGKRAGAQTVQSFLTEQIKEYEQRLRLAEQRLAEFKRRNVGQMPGEQGDYFTRMQTEMAAVEKARAAASIAQSRRDELARQLRGEAANSAGSGGPAGTVDTAARIKEAQSRLDELMLRFTAKHPDVIAARETLDQLKQRQAGEVDAIRRGDPQALMTGEQSTNPVLQNIQISLRQADVDIAALRSEISDRERSVSELRKLVNTVPDVEAELSRLNRDYDVTRGAYTSLVDRLQRARLGDEAEQTESISFKTIDPPVASFEPIEPKRPKLMSMVLVAGLAVGVGVAYLMHLLRPVFNSPRALNEITGYPVIGVVSLAWHERYRTRMYRSYMLYGAATVMLVALFVVALQLGPYGVRLAHQLFGLGGA